MLKFVIITGIVLVVISVLWRLSSKRYVLPCPSWLGWLVELDNPFSKINRAVTIIENAGIKEGMRVLDVGCGPGRVSIPVSNKVGSTGEVVAMDIQEGMLDRTKEKVSALGLKNVQFVQGDVGEGELEKNSFDRVLLVTVLGEIPDQKKALLAVYDVLKPGGVLSVTEIIFDPHFQRRSRVARVANEAGFVEKERFGGFFAYTINLEKPLG